MPHTARKAVRSGPRARLLAAVTASLIGISLVAPAGSPAAGKEIVKPQARVTGDQLSDADARKLAGAKLKRSDSLRTSSVTAAAEEPVDPITQRVLVIATTGDPNPDGVNTVPASTSWDWSLSTMTNTLDYLGMPYDTYKSSSKQLCQNGTWKIVYSVNPTDSTCTGTVQEWGSVTADKLWDGAVTAYYSAVMLVSGNLVYTTDGYATFPTGMTPEEWSALWTFEAAFGIRTVSAFTYPTADYGMTYLGEGASADPTMATYTVAGKSAFPYVASTLPITSSWIYRAAVDPAQSATTTPILTDGGGNVLGVIKTYPEQANRQTLALTFNSARYLTHGLVLGYGLVNWVTKGQFLGFRKAMIDVQPDDIFIEDDIWQYNAANGGAVPQYPDCPDPEDPRMDTYRMTGADLMSTINWQAAKRAQPTTKAFRITWPFVGEGTTAGYWPNDTLTSTARANRGKFKWVNHTWDHTNLDSVTYAQATSLINQNDTLATTMKLKNYTKANLVQPDISGIGNHIPGTPPGPATAPNEEFLRAAYDAGVRNLITDTSRAPWFNPGPNGPNEGTWLTGTGYTLFGVARYPVSLYFNISTPEQWLAEDNCLYPVGAPFGHVDTYEQLLDRESNNLLRYLLQGDNRPLMFHQPNLRAYPGGNGRSVLSDLIDATFAKYNQLVTVPITSPTMDQQATLQQDRMVYNDAWKNGNLTASVVPNTSMTLSSTKDVVVPLTGFRVTTTGLKAENYAGQRITYVPLTAGVPRTIGIR